MRSTVRYPWIARLGVYRASRWRSTDARLEAAKGLGMLLRWSVLIWKSTHKAMGKSILRVIDGSNGISLLGVYSGYQRTVSTWVSCMRLRERTG